MTTLIPRRAARGISNWFGRDPITDLQQEMEELMSRFSKDRNGGQLLETVFPSTDISETEEAVQVQMDVPGFTSKEIDIEVRGNQLQVRGTHKEENEEKGKTFHRIERSQGNIYRSVTLPSDVNAEQVDAECRNGVLTISLPKTEASKAHKIEVKG